METLFLLVSLGAAVCLALAVIWLAIKLQRQRETNLVLEKTLELEKAQFEEKVALLKESKEELSLQFKNLANEIFDDKSKRFEEKNQQSLSALLNPLQDKIKTFEKRVEETYSNEARERHTLGAEIKKLYELNDKLGVEAANLVQALKGDNKSQGNWGEVILTSILERSGLTKGVEYEVQVSLNAEDGSRSQPDVVVHLPESRDIIIDSKVSLNAFTRYSEAETVETQKNELKAHVEAIKNHITSLSKKGYDDYDQALDFVIMFIPSEAAYIAAMSGDTNLWSFAYDKRILLMNPTNLITSLKLIEDLWKREYQNENAIEIADRGAKLYDKFVGFVDNLEKVGGYIEKAQNSYGEAYSQLSTGNDNLVRQATKLKKLGLKTKKALPEQISNDSLGNNDE